MYRFIFAVLFGAACTPSVDVDQTRLSDSEPKAQPPKKQGGGGSGPGGGAVGEVSESTSAGSASNTETHSDGSIQPPSGILVAGDVLAIETVDAVGLLVGGNLQEDSNLVYRDFTSPDRERAFNENINEGPNGTVTQIQRLPYRKILVAGDFTRWTGVHAGGLVLLNADGTLNQEFTSEFGSGASGSILGFAVDRFGRIYIAGNFLTLAQYDRVRNARLLGSGRVDPGYDPLSETPSSSDPPPQPTSAPQLAPIALPTAESVPPPTPSASEIPASAPTAAPTVQPTAAPTASPSHEPTLSATAAPTSAPTTAPTSAPTAAASVAPTVAPTSAPTTAPTAAASAAPTVAPTSAPTTAPTASPSDSPKPEKGKGPGEDAGNDKNKGKGQGQDKDKGKGSGKAP